MIDGRLRLFNMELRVRADAHFVRHRQAELVRAGELRSPDRGEMEKAELYDGIGDILEAMQLAPSRFRKLIVEVRSTAVDGELGRVERMHGGG